jgi:hypothetical protein
VSRPCSLQYTLGVAETCPEARCPYWEDGGAVLPGGCVVQRLGVARDVRLAEYLLELRRKLEDARDTSRG